MEVKNIREVVKKAPLDKGAGIKVVKITGDEKISVFAAEITAGTELTPHYHNIGIEIYQVFDGSGIMKVGSVNGDSLFWEDIIEVSTGDSFYIPEGKVHQILNNSDKDLIMLFTCPENHLSSDRFFIK